MTTVTFETLPHLIKGAFGGRVSVPEVNSETGEVAFILYESFLFKCGFDERYGRFGLVMLLDGCAVRTFFGKRVTMENDEADPRQSERYRSILPVETSRGISRSI